MNWMKLQQEVILMICRKEVKYQDQVTDTLKAIVIAQCWDVFHPGS